MRASAMADRGVRGRARPAATAFGPRAMPQTRSYRPGPATACMVCMPCMVTVEAAEGDGAGAGYDGSRGISRGWSRSSSASFVCCCCQNAKRSAMAFIISARLRSLPRRAAFS